ncbi:MAG: alpha-amylase [Lentimicrobium sp.]|nr:alpha-amylase [Lentimicrobium sp.]
MRFSLLQKTAIFFLIIALIWSCSDKDKPQDKPEAPSNEFILPDPPQFGIPFSGISSTAEVVMYEVNIRAFSNAGKLPGVTERLDHIRSLGVNVIWLMPIHPIGQINSVNSPYSVRNYREVSPEFGTLDDLRNLTEQAHQRGMAVILDWVANHTSWDNPWMKYPSWYTRVNGVVIHPEGTNWQDVADLDYSSAEMRKAMISALKYWILAANVDGFRCDAADWVPYDFWRQAIDSLQTLKDRNLILLAEGGRSDHFNAGFQMNYAWDFYGRLKAVWNGQDAKGLYTTHVSEQSKVPAGKFKLRFTTNHDESAWDATPITIFKGQQGALAASVVATFMGGVPMIYGSQEVGRVNTLPFFSNSPINWEANADMLQEYKNIMTFYTASEASKTGTTTDHSTTDICAFTRTSTSEEILIVVNIRNRESAFELPTAFQNKSGNFNSIVLSPYEYMLLMRNL